MTDQPDNLTERGDHKTDAQSVRPTELKRLYPAEYSSWKNMRYKRTKTEGAIVDPAWLTFANFLTDMGSKPHKTFTLDRYDFNNPTYGPGLCRWADKEEQANNRSTTITLTYQGETLPLTTWAKRTGQNPDVLRRRYREGWSDHEVVEGRPSPALQPQAQLQTAASAAPAIPALDTVPVVRFVPPALSRGVWPAHTADWWEAQWQDHYRRTELDQEPQTRFEFFYRELLIVIPNISNELNDARAELAEYEKSAAEDEVLVPASFGRIRCYAQPVSAEEREEAKAALRAKVSSLEEQVSSLEEKLVKARWHLDRVRPTALRDLQKRSDPDFRKLMKAHPEELAHAVDMPELCWGSKAQYPSGRSRSGSRSTNTDHLL